MKIEFLDVLTLDNDKEYVVSAISRRDNENFYCLINKDQNDDLIICRTTDDENLKEINDPELVRSLLPEFYKSIKNSHILDEFNINLPDLGENA